MKKIIFAVFCVLSICSCVPTEYHYYTYAEVMSPEAATMVSLKTCAENSYTPARVINSFDRNGKTVYVMEIKTVMVNKNKTNVHPYMEENETDGNYE